MQEEQRIGRLLQEQRLAKHLTQEQLAVKAGIPYSSLIKIESGAIRNPSAQSISKLAQALSISSDALFAPKTFLGASSISAIFQDVLASLSEGGGTMYINGVEESRYLRHSSEELLGFVDALKRRGIRQKLLSKEGDKNFLEGDHLEYRWIAKKYFSPVPTYVYGNKVSVILWGPPPQSIILENAMVAEAFRRQFLFIWERAKKVTRSPAAPGQRKQRRRENRKSE